MTKYMTTDEAAELLRYTTEYVRRLAREGRIPALKVGREWRFVESRLVEWIEQGCPSPQEQPSLFENLSG